MKAAARMTQRYDGSPVSTLSAEAAFRPTPTLVLTCHTPCVRSTTRAEVLPKYEKTLRKPCPSLPKMRSKINTPLLPLALTLAFSQREREPWRGHSRPLAWDHRQHDVRGMGSVVENRLRRRLQLSVSK
jgi:hypothetical protein